MAFTPVSLAEARYLLQLSELGGGHAGQRHVGIANDALWSRVEAYRGSGLALRTAFLTFADMTEALAGVLNDPDNADALLRFDRGARQADARHFELPHVPLPRTFRMRYGIGGSARVFPCDLATLVLHKRADRPRGMHIVTFFGTMGPLT